MNKIFKAVFALVLALGLIVGSAEAARLGGGKSVGMQSQSVAPKPAAPAQAAPGSAAAPAGAAAAAPKRNWMGPLAGLAAGLGIAALFSSLGMGGMGGAMGNILMIALLAAAAFFVFKFFTRRKTPVMQGVDPLQFAGAGGLNMAPLPVATPLSGSSAPAVAADLPLQPLVPQAARIPAGFDSASFLRVAKLNFIRLQAANDARNLDDMREFVGPELFAEIRMQLDERGNAPQQTDVVNLHAELLEVTTESSRYIASVHFSGMIREAAGAAANPFDEIWNLSKPAEGSQGWVISGIQQLN